MYSTSLYIERIFFKINLYHELFGPHRYCECDSYISNLNLIPNGKRKFYEVTYKIIYDILWILEAQGTNTTENAENIMGT
jgi:hypothetical protein